MAKRIGIYIRDFTPGGGAEKRSAVMAERLSRTNDVTLLAAKPKACDPLRLMLRDNPEV
jgi:hypothetical protein